MEIGSHTIKLTSCMCNSFIAFILAAVFMISWNRVIGKEFVESLLGWDIMLG